jgi:hypothetical protein
MLPGSGGNLKSVHNPFLSSSYPDPPARYPDPPLTPSPLGFPPGDPFLPPSFPDLSYSYPVLSPSYPDLTPDYPVRSTKFSTQTPGYPTHKPRYLTHTHGYPTHKPGYPVQKSGYPARTPGYPTEESAFSTQPPSNLASQDTKAFRKENFDISEGRESDMKGISQQLQESQTGKILYKTLQQFTSGPMAAVGKINQPTNRASTIMIDKMSNRLPEPQKQSSGSPAVQFVWVAGETGQQKPGLFQPQSSTPSARDMHELSGYSTMRNSRWIQPKGTTTIASDLNKKREKRGGAVGEEDTV